MNNECRITSKKDETFTELAYLWYIEVVFILKCFQIMIRESKTKPVHVSGLCVNMICFKLKQNTIYYYV